MAAEQRTFTEEELADGIPVEPPTEPEPEVETEPEPEAEDMPEGTVVVPAVIEEDLPPEDPTIVAQPHMSLDPAAIVRYGYIDEIQFGREKRYVLSANGISHVAGMMGIEVTKCELEEREDGFIYAQAHARNPLTGASSIGSVRQSIMVKGKPDKFAWEKANTRAMRNARRDLIPCQRIEKACTDYIKGGRR